VLQGLLVEEARTNIALPSVPSVAGGWQSFGSTTTPNSGTAPDGNNTTAKLVDDGTNGIHCLAPGFTIASNQPHTVSVYAKAGEIRYLGIRLDNGVSAGFGATFDLQNGTIALSGASDGGASVLATTIQPAGNGFYRCIVSGNLGANTIGRFALINQITPSYGFPGYQSIVGNGCYVWGAQLEQGAFPTSYIPTTSAAVTRAQDQCSIPAANMSPWFTTTGSWLAEFIFINPAPTGNRIVGAAMPSGTSSVAPLTAGNAPYALGQWDGASYFETVNDITSNVVQKGAQASAGASLAKLCLNGGAVGSGAITNGFASLATTGVRFLQNVTGVSSDNGNGYIRRVQFWPRVLTNAEMQAITA
jgi:hypothetical protein